MNVSVVIPARIASTRFPGKVLAQLGDAPVIAHVIRTARAASLVDEVVVATDAQEVAEVARREGARAFMTPAALRSGTERIASIIHRLSGNLVVNLQGDEPFLNAHMVDETVRTFQRLEGRADIVTPVFKITDVTQLLDPAVVKVVRAKDGRAVYFSRSPVPHIRDIPFEHWALRNEHYGHVGLYGYARATLEDYHDLPESPLENAESLEQLRFLEAGRHIATFVTSHNGPAIDTPADLARARRFLLSGQSVS